MLDREAFYTFDQSYHRLWAGVFYIAEMAIQEHNDSALMNILIGKDPEIEEAIKKKLEKEYAD